MISWSSPAPAAQASADKVRLLGVLSPVEVKRIYAAAVWGCRDWENDECSCSIWSLCLLYFTAGEGTIAAQHQPLLVTPF